MKQVDDHLLWVGHAGDGRNFQQLFAAGIRAVVQVAAEEISPQSPRELIFCHFPLLDGAGNSPHLLSLTVTTVASLLREHFPTLICCGAGMSRSPAIAATALTLVHGESAGKWLELIGRAHPTDVSPALWNDLVAVLDLSRSHK